MSALSRTSSRMPKLGKNWDRRDYALWVTCDLVAAIVDRLPRDNDIPLPHSPFPLRNGETALAHDIYRRHIYTAPGDGTYQRNGGFFFATGPAGLALTGAVAATRIAGNASRRSKAAANAQQRWMPVDSGNLYVTTDGFYMLDNTGLYDWDWNSINTCTITSRFVQMTAQSTEGPCSFAVESDYAELIYVLWALTRHRTHPQLMSGVWLPHNWLARAHAAGYPSRLNRYQIMPG